MTKSRKSLLTTAAIMVCTGSQFAVAQEAQLDEIVVTSTLRAKSVQDIPVTVSVLSPVEIAKADIHDATGIAVNTPGLAYGEFSPGQAIFAMRGIGSADDGAGLDNSVAAFIDGVYIGRGAGVNFDAFDLERIEVLKGPQGALFGRNTIGGAISVVTAKPSLEEFTGKVSLTGGNEGIVRAQGMINGPISDNLAGKIVVNHRQHDGFVRNTLLNQDLNDEDKTSVRGQLLLGLDNMEWVLSGDYTTDERVGMGRFPFVSPFEAVAESLGANRPQTSASPIEGFSDRETYGVSLEGEIELDSGSLISITGFRNVQADWEMPSVGAPLGATDLANGVFGLDVNDDILEDIDTFSQELRWVSDLDGPINFVGGLFYFEEKTDRIEQFGLDINSAAGGQVRIGNEYTRTENETTSYAAYGQGTWDFAEDWTLVLGGRYTRDEKDYVATAVNCADPVGTAPDPTLVPDNLANFPECQGVGGSLSIIAQSFRAPVSDSWENFSPMGSLQYRPSDNLMLFGTVATGFKSGGFAGSQGVLSAASDPVDPEDATNYEIGFKSELLDRRLRLNATGFYMDYRDLQIVRFGPVPNSAFGTFLTTNIGSADILGLEVDWDFLLSDLFTFSGNYAYLDTEVNDLVINGIDVSGKTLRQAPEHSINLIADYHVPMGEKGDLDFNVQYTYVDEQRFDYLDDNTIAQEKKLLDANVTYTTANGKYQLVLWGKNLGDYDYVKHSYVIGPGVIGVWGDPRTYGITAIANF